VLTALFSVLCIAAMFDVARLIHGTAIGLWMALLMALSSAQIGSAQEVRAYPLLILLALLAAAAMLRIERDGPGRRQWLILTLSIFAMLLTHYFAAPAIVAFGLYTLLRLRGRERVYAITAIAGGVLLFAMLWGPMLLRQRGAFAASASAGAYGEATAHHVVDTLGRLALIPVRMLFEPGPRAGATAALGAAIFIVPLLQLRRRRELLLWVLWLDCVVGFIVAIDLARSSGLLVQIRQTLLASPAVFAIFATLSARRLPLMRHGLPALVAIACIGALGHAYERINTRFSAFSTLLAPARGASEPIVFYSDQLWWSDWLLLGASHYSGAFPRACLRLDGIARENVMEELGNAQTIWLVTGSTPLRADQILPGSQVISIATEPYMADVMHVRLPIRPATGPSTTMP
jgi:hypothetical protein